MDDGAWPNLRSLGYSRARRLILIAGISILALTALVMYIRRVDTVEVAGTLLFMPVFVAFVLWGIRGGIVAGVLAAAGYAALRYPAVDAVGAGRFTGLIFSRAVAYIAFGGVGGWSSQQLEGSLTKLEFYDQIDDLTGLYNARFFVQDTDLEMSRSRRYQTIFSIASIDIDSSVFTALGRRQRRTVLRDLGRLLREGVRAVDRPVHARSETHHTFTVVLPETGPQGAAIFTDRLAGNMREALRRRGVVLSPEALGRNSFTFPEDEAGIDALKARFAEIDRTEHPEAARPPQPE